MRRCDREGVACPQCGRARSPQYPVNPDLCGCRGLGGFPRGQIEWGINWADPLATRGIVSLKEQHAEVLRT